MAAFLESQQPDFVICSFLNSLSWLSVVGDEVRSLGVCRGRGHWDRSPLVFCFVFCPWVLDAIQRVSLLLMCLVMMEFLILYLKDATGPIRAPKPETEPQTTSSSLMWWLSGTVSSGRKLISMLAKSFCFTVPSLKQGSHFLALEWG